MWHLLLPGNPRPVLSEFMQSIPPFLVTKANRNAAGSISFGKGKVCPLAHEAISKQHSVLEIYFIKSVCCGILLQLEKVDTPLEGKAVSCCQILSLDMEMRWSVVSLNRQDHISNK